MRVIVSGGGTGGHIYPALTIARTIEALEPQTEFLYVGTKQGLEAKIVPQEGFPFETLPVQGLSRKLSLSNLTTMGKSASSILLAMRMIKKFKPDVVIGTGGYVCGPMLLAASLCKIPTLIQEQNVIAGVTNRILSRFVDLVAVGYEEAIPSFKACKRVVHTGNPVRPAVLTASREEGRKQYGLKDDTFTILVAGGSRGARSINRAMIDVHKYFKDREDVRIIHATGMNEYDSVCQALGIRDGESYSSSSTIVPYLHDMPLAMAASDLAVFRAGAVGLAELTVRGIPSILIPYPYAAEDHQTFNAEALVQAGAARMIVDKLLTADELRSDIEFFLNNKEERQRMAEATKAAGRPKAAEDIAKLALSIAKKK